MDQPPKAFLLHGFLGAGFAKHLEIEEEALRFTHDEWMSQLYGDGPPEEHFSEYACRVSVVMEGMRTRCLDLGTSVILDFGFWWRADRERTRALVATHGGDAVLYRLNCAEDVAWERINTRNQTLAGSLFIAPNTFRVLGARFEQLRDDEPRIEIGSPIHVRLGALPSRRAPSLSRPIASPCLDYQEAAGCFASRQ